MAALFWWTGAIIWIGLPSYIALYAVTYLSEVTILTAQFWLSGRCTNLPLLWWTLLKETVDSGVSWESWSDGKCKIFKRPSLEEYTWGLRSVKSEGRSLAYRT